MRILLTSDCSAHATGYAVYGHQLLTRLKAEGHEVAELSAHLAPGDPVSASIPWKCYPTMPGSDPAEQEEFYRCPLSQFGAWKFEAACLDFRPDVVLSITDWWMCSFIEKSPFRRHFKWVWMPPVDSAPQDEQWVATMAGCDGLLVYSEWALDVLAQQSGGSLKVAGVASPGADLETFRPVQDMAGHRRMLGLDPDAFLVGTCMRNMTRKLYPDLFEAFRLFLDTAPPEIARKTYLYCHTGYPDCGWDLPRLLRDCQLASRVVFTYQCQACRRIFPSFYADARTGCPRCHRVTAMPPATNGGLSRAELAAVMASWDLYLQVSTAEGLGMPQVEAAACGVPVMSVDYSAMSDVVRHVNGTPIPVERFYWDAPTHSRRAMPDNKALARLLVDFLSQPVEMRNRARAMARLGVEERYTWQKATDAWVGLLNSLNIPSQETTWRSPPRLVAPAGPPPQGLGPAEFAAWGISQVAGRPDLAASPLALRMARDLSWGVSPPQLGGGYFHEAPLTGGPVSYRRFGVEEAMAELRAMAERHNHWEGRRAALLGGKKGGTK